MYRPHELKVVEKRLHGRDRIWDLERLVSLLCCKKVCSVRVNKREGEGEGEVKWEGERGRGRGTYSYLLTVRDSGLMTYQRVGRLSL